MVIPPGRKERYLITESGFGGDIKESALSVMRVKRLFDLLRVGGGAYVSSINVTKMTARDSLGQSRDAT